VKEKQLTGLIAAPFTPFGDDGELNLDLIPAYYAFLTSAGPPARAYR